MPKQTTFSFLKEGVLEVKRLPQDQDFMIISKMIEDMTGSLEPGAPVLKKGQLILSYLTPSNKLYMHRYLEKGVNQEIKS